MYAIWGLDEKEYLHDILDDTAIDVMLLFYQRSKAVLYIEHTYKIEYRDRFEIRKVRLESDNE